MDNIFVVGCVISTVFFLAKFLEMRFSVEEPRPQILDARYCGCLRQLHYRLLLTPSVSVGRFD